MRKNEKLVLIAASLVSVAISAHAGDGELIVGFDGNSTDYLYDLGANSSLHFGQTWAFPANLGSRFGVVGSDSITQDIWNTYSAADEGGYMFNYNLFNTIQANVQTLSGQGAGQTPLTPGTHRTTLPTDATGWTQQTDQPIGSVGNTFQNNYALNINVDVGSPAYLFNNDGITFPDVALGYFTYDPVTGILKYNAQAPAPVTLSISVTNVSTSYISTISFPSANGVTYTLFYTNSLAPGTTASSWPSNAVTIIGDGTTKSFKDTNSTGAVRFYSVGGH